MNEKFFDLKKDKQDRIINAALKIFALHGYRQANTDDMVREAAISKGLLFHYFASKEGLFGFICDYSIKYTKMEIGTVVCRTETDYFEICKQLELAKYRIMRQFPYMILFMENSSCDRTAELPQEERKQLGTVFTRFSEEADYSAYCSEEDFCRLHNIVGYTLAGSLRKWSSEKGIQPEKIAEENAAYLSMLQEMTSIYSSYKLHPQDNHP